MKNCKPVTTVIALLICGVLAAQETKVLTTDAFKISFNEAWTMSENGDMGTLFILRSPKFDNEDHFQENINLMMEDISTHDLNLAAYAEIAGNQIKEMLPGSEILSSQAKQRGDRKFQEVIFTAPNGSYRLKFLQQYFLAEKKVYILTYTAEAKNYDQYIEEVKKMMKSFVLQ